MAAGLQRVLFHREFALGVVLFLGGGALASASVMVRPRPEPGFVVELYSREGCGLCEEARAWLEAKAPEYDFALWVTDVDRHPALAQAFGDHVPVGVLVTDARPRRRGRRRSGGDEELFRLKADYVALERRFRKLADARVRG